MRSLLRAPVARALLVAAVVGFAMSAAPAFAQYSLSTAGTPDFVRGLVPVRVNVDSTVETVTVTCERANTPVQTLTCTEESPDVFVAWVAPGERTEVQATAFAGGVAVWQSAPAVLQGSTYRPASPTVVLKRNALVRSPQAFSGRTGPRATRVRVLLKRGSAWVDAWSGDVTADAAGEVRLPPVSVPKGAGSVRLVSQNGFGSVTGPYVDYYNLGKTPSPKKYVLVDKSDRRLYEVHSGVVTFTTRVAIGLPWAPTPSGTFKLGKRMKTPSSVWGPWRMPLLRKAKSGKWVRTSYYLHGTNRPSSIGKRASHGCVRVLNKHIRVLSKRLRGYTIVIRP